MYLKHGVIIITGVTLPCTPLPCPSHRRITSPQGVHTWPKAVHNCALLLQGFAMPKAVPLPPPLLAAVSLRRFAGVSLEGVEGLGLFPPPSRGVSAGFCGCFDEPAASAFTSARAAASPGQLTILRMASSCALKISAPSRNGRTPRVGRDWDPEQGQAYVHCRKIIQCILAGLACHICCF